MIRARNYITPGKQRVRDWAQKLPKLELVERTRIAATLSLSLYQLTFPSESDVLHLLCYSLMLLKHLHLSHLDEIEDHSN